jgi:hypothetical protein
MNSALRRSRLRIKWPTAGPRRLHVQEIFRVFVAHTGRVPSKDDQLLDMLFEIKAGLAAAVGNPAWDLIPSRRLEVFCDPSEPDPLPSSTASPIAAPRTRGRGQPPIHPRLSQGLADLTKELGPKDAALLLLLYGFDRSRAFPVALPPPRGHGFDASILLRRIERRLSYICRSVYGTRKPLKAGPSSRS